HRTDLDDCRLTTLAEAIAREPEAGLVIDRLVAGRDAVVIPRPVFFECGGFGKAGGDAAFGWRLLEQLGVMGYRPRDVATSGDRSRRNGISNVPCSTFSSTASAAPRTPRNR